METYTIQSRISNKCYRWHSYIIKKKRRLPYACQKSLKVLSCNGLFLKNTSKSTFVKLKFLSHSIGVNGKDVLSTKVKANRIYPILITSKDLKRLGLINYYHKFVTRMTKITAPLNKITEDQKKTIRTKPQLNKAQVQSFEKTKCALAEAANLEYEDHSKPFILSFDASTTCVGAVFEQEKEKRKIVPLSFFSKCLPRLSRVRWVFY